MLDSLFSMTNLYRLAEGVGITLFISLVSIGLSIVFGSLVGLCMLVHSVLVRGVCRLYLEFVRIVPILALLYVFYFGLPQALDININNLLVGILVFSLWGSAEMADLVRGAFSSISAHQRESALSLGLSWIHTQAFVILPQATARLLPGSINLFTRIIKTTSLLLFIGVGDVFFVARQIIEANHAIPSAPFVIYGLLLVLYFALCYPLSYLAKRLESKATNGGIESKH
ncbi:amino acid ABC transporter permease [uncultured Helicobacter sp.]|uniref:amino acid ABC transporter permease n=1 Tax=uncultured Helicobacter sp. TaxID=175537 RepID=UPI00374E866D